MTTAAPPCVHWDKIPMPNGPVSMGRCIYCGREKEYANVRWPDYNSEPLNDPQERRWNE